MLKGNGILERIPFAVVPREGPDTASVEYEFPDVEREGELQKGAAGSLRLHPDSFTKGEETAALVLRLARGARWKLAADWHPVGDLLRFTLEEENWRGPYHE